MVSGTRLFNSRRSPMMTAVSLFLALTWQSPPTLTAAAFCRTPAPGIVASSGGERRRRTNTSHPKWLSSNPLKLGPDDDSARTRKRSTAVVSWALASSLLIFNVLTRQASAMPPYTTAPSQQIPDDTEGLASVTQSDLGRSVRRFAVRGAQLADTLDRKWERFSDGLRDKNKCDPVTDRRLFDNGYRRDGTPVGNPVLGALCAPVPLRELDEGGAEVVLDLAEEAARGVFGFDKELLRGKVEEVRQLVAPAFSRAASRDPSEEEAKKKRQMYNMDVYTTARAYGEILTQTESPKEATKNFELSWGNKLLSTLAPNANRKDFKSPFPPPDPTDEPLYDEGALLDSLGKVSAALRKMQESGLIGHWEMSIPEDDFGEVVTIAVDDDITIGAQVLLREQRRALGGSAVVAMLRAAMDQCKIPYSIDTFFIDPSTTRQELYNPTQLLVSLSDLGM